MKQAIVKKPFLLFLPFLIFYIIIVLLLQSKHLVGDEGRYMADVNNLLHGFFSPPQPGIRLFNGPGYPILLMPFQLLHLPVTAMRLLNPVLLYLSLVLLYKTLGHFVSLKKNILCCLFLACYFNMFIYLYLAISEVVTVFLVTLLLFLLTKAFEKEGKRKHLILAGFTFGYLCLTKVIFGYVLACILLGVLALWFFNRKAQDNKKMLLVTVVACITVMPYLGYTYKLTGRMFYWSSMGGNNLYWMSTAHPDEYGSWFSQPELENGVLVAGKLQNNGVFNDEDKAGTGYVPGHRDSLLAHNQKDFIEILKYKDDVLALDDAYKKAAFKNIQAHPVKFITNCISNTGRMLFNFPYSYSLQKPGTLARLPLNGVLVVLFIFCLLPALRNWKKIPVVIRLMLFIAALYFGGSILGSAEIRMFNPLVPILLLFISYTLQRAIQIRPLSWNGERQ